MKPESIGNKYKAIEEIYGKEAKDFVKKLIEIFAKSRGQEAPLKYQLLDLYNTGEIVPYEEGQSTDGLQGKILLKHGEVEEKDYWGPNAIFGYVDRQGIAHFAEVSRKLYEWDGKVASLTTAILDLARSFHEKVIENEKKHNYANRPEVLIRGLIYANRLSDHIKIVSNH